MKSIARLAAGFALAVATLTAAGAAGPAAPADTAQRSAVPAKPDDRTILHVLNRTGFGARPGDVERVRQQGLSAYLDRQLQPGTVDDEGMQARLASMATLRLSSRELAGDYFVPAMVARRQNANRQSAPETMTPDAGPERTPGQMAAARRAREVLVELSEQKILRAAFSERQLEEVMVDFWFNHFNVFAGKGATMTHLTAYERDAIRPHLLGRFRDLLGATAKSPAMLFYLDNWQSAGPSRVDSLLARRRAMFDSRPTAQRESRRRGLNENYGRELLELHTLGVDGGYTQQDVVDVARAFTGWTIDQPRLGGGFRFDDRLHDAGEKVILGQKIKAGGGQSDGERVLDMLASHPSTATSIATKLARRFVADTPPPSLVGRAAARFRETGGDIREVVRTILTAPEFYAPEAYRAKVKTPFEFVVSTIRATGSDVTEAMPLVQAVRQLGMPLYMCQPPTGYADRADAWVNTGALLNRMNFALQLVGGRIRGVRAGSAAPAAALGGEISETTAATIARASDPRQNAALTLGSPEFQRK
jgi:uncharacterized protein (DUF1800 family)